MNKNSVKLYGYDMNISSISDETSLRSAESEIYIALIDTGIDTNNEIISSVLEKSGNIKSEQGKFSELSKWNLCDGTEQMIDDAFTDSHGTSMFGLIVDIKWSKNSNHIESYQDNLNIISLKALNGTGGRFIDILTAIKIADLQKCQIINCSFSIKNQCYKNILEKVLENSNAFFVFSQNNNVDQDILLFELPNVLYVSDGIVNETVQDNFISLNLGEVNILGFDNEILSQQSNSCATAYMTNRIAKMYLNEQIELTSDSIIKNY